MSVKKELAVPSFLSHLKTLCIGMALGNEPNNFCSVVKRLHSTDFGNVVFGISPHPFICFFVYMYLLEVISYLIAIVCGLPVLSS